MKLKRVKSDSAVEVFVSGKGIKSVIIIPGGRRIVGSVYKYAKLISKFSDVYIHWAIGFNRFKREMERIEPDFVFVWGDGQTNYAFAQRLGLSYVLVEMDVFSLRWGDMKAHWFEPDMVKGAEKIICTSKLHAEYLKKKYKVESLIIPLKPFSEDLEFSPKPKIPGGNNLVYAGSLVGSKDRHAPYGYRYYIPYFKKLKALGWNIHLYPGYELSNDRIDEYDNAGFTIHNHIAQNELYRELSQYDVGFHGYNKEGVPEVSFNYSQMCLPNKTWEYLAAGIPTISYNGGFSSDFIKEGGWGKKLRTLNKEFSIDNIKITYKMRHENIIDPYVEDLKKLLGIVQNANIS
ncbi:MAG: hypothetical protein OEM46_00585 [Ignavibacteria bacterium]|nr:hypothetical protein [Ignavibacteria bacterium]